MNDQPLILSIRQPWAHLILHHGKDIENRTWSTKVRGRILIHAGKSWDENPKYWDEIQEFDQLEDRTGKSLDRGGIVGSVEIVDCVQDSHSYWFFGPHGFVLRNPVVLPFEPMQGRLGFFRR